MEAPTQKYEEYFKNELQLVNESLDKLLPSVKQQPALIHEAMRYSVFPGGKRFRAVLVLAACEALGGDIQKALIPAASLELIHSYSLVHDDLPALDDDDLRRGVLTCHKKYGEAMAILAGDGLLTHAFQILSQIDPPEVARALLAEISTSSGTYGMIGGQVADLTVPEGDLNMPMLEYIHSHKTGKLIKASAVCGAISAGASEENRHHILRYGELLGLAFQGVDDLLDGDGYMKLMKAGEVHDMVRDLLANAKRELKLFSDKAAKLHKLVDYLLMRVPGKNKTTA